MSEVGRMTDSDGEPLIFEVYDSGDVMISDGTASRAYLATEAKQEEFAQLYVAACRRAKANKAEAAARAAMPGQVTP